MVSGHSFGSSTVSLACITSMCSVQCFRGGHSLRLAFGSFFYPHPFPPRPLYSSTVNQCDRCLVPLAWGLMARGRGFASNGGVTLCRCWLCQRWKPLDIPGTHLHSVTQLLILDHCNLLSVTAFSKRKGRLHDQTGYPGRSRKV